MIIQIIFIYIYILNIFFVGNFFLEKIGLKEKTNSLENFFYGFIIIGFFALFLNFFIKLDILFNTLLFIVLTFFSFKNIFNNKIIDKLKESLIILTLSLIILAYSKIHEDSAGYHIPYSNIINDSKIIFGISNIHFRFGHISIFQYIDAIGYNYFLKNSGLITSSAILVSSIYLFFLKEIKKIKKINAESCFVIFAFLFIILRFNRYGDFGTDAQANLYVILTFYFLIKSIKKNQFNLFLKALILSMFAFLQKIFFLPLFFFIILLGFYNFQNKFVINKTSFFVIIFSSLWLIKNFIVSGCFLYPVYYTCLNIVSWYSNNPDSYTNAFAISLQSEAWAKSWNTYYENGIQIDYKTYLTNFTWLPNWLINHGKVIVSKLLFFLILSVVFIFVIGNSKLLFTLKNNIKYYYNKKFLLLFGVSLFLLLSWFLKFPIFRYGASYIFFVFYFIFLHFSNRQFKIKKNFILYSLIILLSIPITKNIWRIYNNFHAGNFFPEINISKLTNDMQILRINNYTVYSTSYYGCFYGNSPCTSEKQNLDNIKIKKKYNYLFINLKNLPTHN